MDPAILSAMSALLGSLVGGSASIVTAWIAQKTQSRHALIREEVTERAYLYTEFIDEITKLTADSLTHALERPETVLPAYALVNRIGLRSSKEVYDAANQTVQRVIDQYFGRNMTVDELHALVRTMPNPLQAFTEASRHELHSLSKQV